MNDWKVIPTIVLATVLIFGAGVVTGGILVDYVKQARPRMAAKHPNPAPPAPPISTNNPVRPPQILRDKDFLQRLEAEMPLTKEEHDTIQKIISDNQNQVRKVVQDARLEIRDALTPAHREQFDELMKRPFHKPLFGTNAPPPTAPTAPATAP